MNEAEPSIETRRQSAVTAPADRPVSSTHPSSDSAAAASAHPLVWALQLWVVASVTSLMLSAGLGRALRGAFVGAQEWILRIDGVSDRTSQFAAICTALLLVYMGMLCTKASRSFTWGMGAALLGAAPTFILFYAHQLVLPHAHSWIAALCASATLLICAHQARSRMIIRAVVLAGGLSLLAQALRTADVADNARWLVQLGAQLRPFFAWATLLLALGWHLWTTKDTPWRGALLLGGAVLLAATVRASSEPGVSRATLLIGRSLIELAPYEQLGLASPLLFSLALLLVFSNLARWPGSLGQLICSVLALSCTAPTTPLVVGWITLCGLSAVVIRWVPDDDLRQQSRAGN